MEQGYCGRDCADCEVRGEYGCAGCLATGGVPPHGACPVASCCREKGLKRCGDCRFVGCQLLPEYNGERKSLEHLEMVSLEALGGSTRAMELGCGLMRLFWVWLLGSLSVGFAEPLVAILRIRGGPEVLRIIPVLLCLTLCLGVGRILRQLGGAYKAVIPFLAAFAAAYTVCAFLTETGAALAGDIVREGLKLCWIFRLYDANGAQLEQIGSRRAVLWRNMAWWTAAVDVVTYAENIALSWTSGGRMFWLWMEELPDAVFFLLAGMLNLLSWVLTGAWLALILLRWVQLYRTAGEFRRLGACGKQSC